jgi:hypothetical protein
MNSPHNKALKLAAFLIHAVLQEVCDFVRLRLSTGMEPEVICEELMTRCLAPDCHMGGLGCDNMTVVLACFLHGETFNQLVAKCSRPAPRHDYLPFED